MDRINVGITGTGSLIGQAVIKSIKISDLARRVSLVGMDYFPGTIGSYWTDRNHLLPDLLKPDIFESEWLAELTRIIRIEQLDYLFVGVDFELPVLAANKTELYRTTGCTVIVSDPEVIRVGNDKYETVQFLTRHGIPAPETILFEDYQAGMIQFPCIVKPAIGARSRGVSIARTEADLRTAASAIERPIIQELIGNADCEYTCGAIFLGNEVREVISLRRSLREGNTSDAYYDGPLAHVDEYVARVARCLRPMGACNVQLRLDAEGSPKLFEINPRHSGTTYIRALFGFNEVEYILKTLLGESSPVFELRKGLVKRFYDEAFWGQHHA